MGDLPDGLGEDLVAAAVDLGPPHRHDRAWDREQVVALCERLHGTRVAVLGGAVYVEQPWGFAATGAGWECERLPGESAPDYAVRSRVVAREFVGTHSPPLGRTALFALFLSDQQDAA